MGADLTLSEEQLLMAAGALAEIAGEMRQGLLSLDSQVDSDLLGNWTGQAADAYKGVWNKWVENMAMVVFGLQSMSNALRQAAEGYRGQDGEGASAIKKTEF